MNAVLRVLILGGTGEGAALAAALIDAPGIEAISSLAGLLTAPRLPPGRVRVGGFGGVEGLTAHLEAERIDAVVDATHPFAARISANAALACARARVPLAAFVRAPWTRGPGDRWYEVPDLRAAAACVRSFGTRVFLTVGRGQLAEFADLAEPWFLIRAIDAPQAPLPPRHEILLRRPPFALAEEIELMRSRAIDLLVTKNSGGAATSAKLEAARALGIPVAMVQRPPRTATRTVDSVAKAMAWLEGLRERAEDFAPARRQNGWCR
ncbi:MAG TPA: cobalt-precorrin-6A reductase [Candidatus Acidoferrum sp.]|jgi:precorrin-6A/cobalt-precorrin-6A reductase|nr:cobalt-precorrin-6A reductase [Candidatus Acidoferrum sp.]